MKKKQSGENCEKSEKKGEHKCKKVGKKFEKIETKCRKAAKKRKKLKKVQKS